MILHDVMLYANDVSLDFCSHGLTMGCNYIILYHQNIVVLLNDSSIGSAVWEIFLVLRLFLNIETIMFVPGGLFFSQFLISSSEFGTQFETKLEEGVM